MNKITVKTGSIPLAVGDFVVVEIRGLISATEMEAIEVTPLGATGRRFVGGEKEATICVESIRVLETETSEQ